MEGMEGTASVLLLRAISARLPPGDPAWRALLRSFGDPPLDAPDARVPLSALVAAWEAAAAITGDPAFGLHLGARLEVGPFDILDYLTRSSPDLGAGISAWVRYQRLLVDDVGFTLKAMPWGLRVGRRPRRAGLAYSRHGVEYAMAGFVVRARQVTGAPLRPRDARLAVIRPEVSAAEYEAVLGVPPDLGAGVDELDLDAADLGLPLLHADAGLLGVLDRHARQALDALPPVGRTTDRVRHEVARRFSRREPVDLASVGTELRVGGRALQRALAAEGATWSGVVDEVRREVALTCLAERRLALGEVAWLLGFADPSAFHRAFVRWTGTPPGAWRAERQRAGSSTVGAS